MDRVVILVSVGIGRHSQFFSLSLALLLALGLTGCARGRTLPLDPASGLVDLPTASPTPPRPGLPLPLPGTPGPDSVLPGIGTPSVFVLPTLAPAVSSTLTTTIGITGTGGIAATAPLTASISAEPPKPSPTRPSGTATPRPTATATFEPSPTPTVTPTEGPPTRTPVPTVSSAYAFVIDRTYTMPNCGLTEIRGKIRDMNGRPVAGQVIRVSSLTDGSAAPKISLPSKADGTYDVYIASRPEGGRWQVTLLTPGGLALAAPVVVETTETDCQPSGKGAQSVFVEYRQVR